MHLFACEKVIMAAELTLAAWQNECSIHKTKAIRVRAYKKIRPREPAPGNINIYISRIRTQASACTHVYQQQYQHRGVTV